MLTDPASFAAFEYRKDHLEGMAIAGDDLAFADNRFDFAFCLSSIAHFGSRDTQRRSFAETARVLKPGGI
jgi:ubiquinone/menaquinone biosynthesis C-methylase UbiE